MSIGTIRAFRFLIPTLVFGLCQACQRDTGPTRYDVSGSVSFQGQPVPYGRIVFQPDGSQENSGPQGYAVIQDGTYDSARSGKGAVGGPQTVIIDGFDGVSTSDDSPYGSMLFPTYRTKVTIEADAEDVDFNVAPKR